MDDQEFNRRIQKKIERLTGRSVEVRIDQEEANQFAGGVGQRDSRVGTGFQRFPVFRVCPDVLRILSGVYPRATAHRPTGVPTAAVPKLTAPPGMTKPAHVLGEVDTTLQSQG